ncbi:ATP-binding protein [Methanoplanus endosymbiosus]|uniref:AAA family ATPase n=1 Tax=Methanoplanus endosymbiosus TaxID=33865 RepID=A0A9E7PML7_9EURY|nr:AAA family ATPase [Methanoplanus endosymbiosus]UUX93003.1 AAA family ATPase [Methanoplanus endosymbiosus]
MKINRMFIDGFGLFHKKQINDISPGLTLVKGPNEAGKSTILAFIRRIIFGFPKKSGTTNQYQPLNGGTLGGRLSVSTSEGKEYDLTRLSGNRNFSVTLPDGSKTDAGLNRIIGSADQNLFENVFAFGLDELQKLETLSGEKIQSQLMSAGAGMTKVPISDVVDELNKKKRELYYSGARGGPEISKKIKKITENQSELKRYSDTQSRYEELKITKEETERDILDKKTNIRSLKSRLSGKERIKAAWEDWVGLKNAKDELSALPELASFPEKGVDKLERLNEKISDLQSDLDDENRELNSTEENISKISIDEDVILNKDEIRILEKGLEKYKSDKNSVSDLNSENTGLSDELKSRIKVISNTWTTDDLLTFDTSQSAKSNIEKFRDEFSEKNSEIRDIEREILSCGEAISGTEDKVSSLKAGLSDIKSLIPKDELVSKLSVLESLSAHISELKQEKYVLDDLREKEAQAKTDYENKKRLINNKIPLWPAALLVVAGIIGLIAGIAGNLTQTGVVIFLILGVSAVVLYFGIKRTNDQNERNLFNDSENPDEKNSELSRLRVEKENLLEKSEKELTDKSRICGFSMIPDSSAIAGRKQEYHSMETRIAEYERICREIDQLNGSLKRQNEVLEETVRRKSQAESNLSEVKGKWQEWLKSVRLDLNITPESALDLFSLVKEARNIHNSISKNEGRISKLKESLSEFESKLAVVLNACGIQSQHSVEKGVYVLGNALEENENISKYLKNLRELEERHRKITAEYSARLQKAENDKTELLKSGSSENEVQFRENHNIWVRSEELKKEAADYELRLKKASGNISKYDEFLSTLESSDISEVNNEISELNSEMSDIQEEIESLKVKSGEINSILSGLEKEDDYSLLLMDNEALREEIFDDSRRWAKYVIAQQILNEAVQKYENERQPEVYRLAQDYFRSITDGKYQKIIKPVSSDDILIEADDGNRIDTYSLSRGTAEQLYLAIRFGHISVYGKNNEPLPVIFDDILVNFDPERKRNCCDAILKLSKTNQILFFTCHPDIVQIMQEKSPGLKVIDLESI